MLGRWLLGLFRPARRASPANATAAESAAEFRSLRDAAAFYGVGDVWQRLAAEGAACVMEERTDMGRGMCGLAGASDFCFAVACCHLTKNTRWIGVQWAREALARGLSPATGTPADQHYAYLSEIKALTTLGRDYPDMMQAAVGQAQKAVAIAGAVADQLMREEDYVPGHPAYGVMIRWLVEGNEIEEANRLALKAASEGWKPYLSSYTRDDPWNEAVEREMARVPRRRKRWRYPPPLIA